MIHAQIQKVLSDGTTISNHLQLTSKRHLNANNGPKFNAGLVAFVIFQGIRTSIAKKPYIYVILGGRNPFPPLSGSAHAISYRVRMAL